MITRCRDPRLQVTVCLCLTASSVIACKLPVFRYALERWAVDRYRMVALIDGESNDQVDAALSQLGLIGNSHVNIDVETIDLSKLSEQQLWQVEGLESGAKTPRLYVYFPERDGQRKLCWSGDLTRESVDLWRDSKLRRQIVGDITNGVSAVWILVEGRDAKENARMAKQLQSALTDASETISIPDGVIPLEDASNYLKKHPGSSMDDVLRSEIPLKIDFVSRRLALVDDEQALRAMISGWNDLQGSDSDRAFVFPVFGRGRMIEPLSAEQFSEEAVIAACRYMVGECNCTLKELNPGVDLVLDANWSEFMDESLVIVDPASPESAQTVAIPAGRSTPANVASNNSSAKRNHTWVVVGLLALAILALFGARQLFGS